MNSWLMAAAVRDALSSELASLPVLLGEQTHTQPLCRRACAETQPVGTTALAQQQVCLTVRAVQTCAEIGGHQASALLPFKEVHARGTGPGRICNLSWQAGCAASRSAAGLAPNKVLEVEWPRRWQHKSTEDWQVCRV